MLYSSEIIGSTILLRTILTLMVNLTYNPYYLSEIFFVTGTTFTPQQRIATKDDYIYIPLKGPTPNNTPQQNATFTHSTPRTPSNNINNNHNNSSYSTSLTTSKPPLPKQPPRVVHASVKKSEHAGAKRPEPNAGARRAEQYGVARRRRTIDSMEPMGLIETDLDTEVTVITSGNVKTTRSLLDLGPCQPKVVGQKEESGDTRHRPHKSMEFLLDKENLKVVEVSGLFCFCCQGIQNFGSFGDFNIN